jgi:hypothetical protein
MITTIRLVMVGSSSRGMVSREEIPPARMMIRASVRAR